MTERHRPADRPPVNPIMPDGRTPFRAVNAAPIVADDAAIERERQEAETRYAAIRERERRNLEDVRAEDRQRREEQLRQRYLGLGGTADEWERDKAEIVRRAIVDATIDGVEADGLVTEERRALRRSSQYNRF